MKTFIRDEEYMTKLFDLGITGRDVHTDVLIKIQSDYGKGGKLRAWCEKTQTWLQFPNSLRFRGTEYVADVYRVPDEDTSRAIFYKPVKGSIRKKGCSTVLA